MLFIACLEGAHKHEKTSSPVASLEVEQSTHYDAAFAPAAGFSLQAYGGLFLLRSKAVSYYQPDVSLFVSRARA